MTSGSPNPSVERDCAHTFGFSCYALMHLYVTFVIDDTEVNCFGV